MDSRSYQRIYEALGSQTDLKEFALEHNLSYDLVQVVHTLKIIRETKSRYYKVKKQIRELSRRWVYGESFLDISGDFDFSPVLIASLILQVRGLTKNEWKNYVRNPDGIPDYRVRQELFEALGMEKVYSPQGVVIQRQRGLQAEEKINIWLKGRRIEFITEKQAKERNYSKTPDFLLDGTITVDGRSVNWVESKASFGDRKEVKQDYEKQLKHYVRLFGPGMVVYWFGFLDDITIEDEILLKDGSFVSESTLKRH